MTDICCLQEFIQFFSFRNEIAMARKKFAIGIDLGTSKCCVGVIRNGKVQIMENERGKKTTPSYVAFTDTERLIGDDAKDQVVLNPTNTVYGFKRLLGLNSKDAKQFTYCLSAKMDYSTTDQPKFRVQCRKTEILWSPELMAAMMLTKMKNLVQEQFDCSVEEAVISVPATWTENQRRATERAAIIAGFKGFHLIDETTAAAVSYIQNKQFAGTQNIVIFDMGGGLMNVSLFALTTDSVKLIAKEGISYGGLDFDSELRELLLTKFKNVNEMKDCDRNCKLNERLREAAESAKHKLTLLSQIPVNISDLTPGTDLDDIIQRNEFEKACNPLFTDDIPKLLKRLFSNSSLSPEDISEVVLSGGSSRIPAVRRALQTFFNREDLNKTINADEAVAAGATVVAGMMSGEHLSSNVSISGSQERSTFTTSYDIDNKLDSQINALKQLEEEEKKALEVIEEVSNLESKCFELKRKYGKGAKIQDVDSNISSELVEKCDKILDFLDNDDMPSSDVIQKFYGDLECLEEKLKPKTKSPNMPSMILGNESLQPCGLEALPGLTQPNDISPSPIRSKDLNNIPTKHYQHPREVLPPIKSSVSRDDSVFKTRTVNKSIHAQPSLFNDRNLAFTNIPLTKPEQSTAFQKPSQQNISTMDTSFEDIQGKNKRINANPKGYLNYSFDSPNLYPSYSEINTVPTPMHSPKSPELAPVHNKNKYYSVEGNNVYNCSKFTPVEVHKANVSPIHHTDTELSSHSRQFQSKINAGGKPNEKKKAKNSKPLCCVN